MKKLIVLILSAVLLSSMLVFSVSAEQTNMEVNVPKFTAKPTFDGVISVEEWGEPTVHMRTDYAADVDSEEIGYDPDYDVRNIFYWFDVEELCDDLSYDIWIRWDEDYLYLAAKVEDPDPFSLQEEGPMIWNGDMVQFKVDTAGPGAVMLKGNPEWDYKTEPFNGNRFNKPWYNDSVFNGILGLSYGQNPTAWKENADGDHDMVKEGALLGITCVTHEPAGDQEWETNTISYEVAVPWSEIDETYVPTVGSTLGMCVVAACSDTSSLNAWLQWGHGICSVSQDNTQPRGTRGGSQAVILVDDETVTPAESYETAGEAPEATEPAEETNAPDATKAPDATDAADDGKTTTAAGAEGETTTKAPAQNNNSNNTNNNNKTSDGLSTGAIVGIVIAAIVVIAAVVIVIVKKKK